MKNEERRLRFSPPNQRAVLYGSSPAVIFESARPMTKSKLTRVMTGLGWKRSRRWVQVALDWETYYSKREGGKP